MKYLYYFFTFFLVCNSSQKKDDVIQDNYSIGDNPIGINGVCTGQGIDPEEKYFDNLKILEFFDDAECKEGNGYTIVSSPSLFSWSEEKDKLYDNGAPCRPLLWQDYLVYKDYKGHKNCTFILVGLCFGGMMVFNDNILDPEGLREYEYLCENGFEEEKIFLFAARELAFKILKEMKYNDEKEKENPNYYNYYYHIDLIHLFNPCADPTVAACYGGFIAVSDKHYYKNKGCKKILKSRGILLTGCIGVCNYPCFEIPPKIFDPKYVPVVQITSCPNALKWDPHGNGAYGKIKDMNFFGRCKTWACQITAPYAGRLVDPECPVKKIKTEECAPALTKCPVAK